MKLSSGRANETEARIEIIPLIDIMFFLLASFMLVSLSMVNTRSVGVSLPTAATGTSETRNSFVDISIDKTGTTYIDKKVVGANELVQRLGSMKRTNDNLRVLIHGDRTALHGDIVRVLDVIRSTGIQKVAFATEPSSALGRSSP